MSDETMSAGTVVLGVEPSTKDFGKKLSQQVSEETSRSDPGGGVGEMILGGLKKFALPIAAVVTSFSVGEFIHSSIQEFENLAGSVRNIQRVTGGTVGEVSDLRGAMQLAGVDADSTSSAFRIFSKHLSDASLDADKLSQMNSRLGGSITDANGALLPMSQLLPVVADKFKDMPNGVEKTALATELFGRNGTQLIPVLNKGSAGMAELADKASQLGLVLDDQAMTIFANAKTATREYDAALQGMKVTIGESLLPVLEAFQDIYRKSLAPIFQEVSQLLFDNRDKFIALAGKIEEFANKVAPVALAVFNFFTDAFTNLSKGVAGVGDIFNNLGEIITGWINGGGIEKALSGFGQMRMVLIQKILDALPGIIDAFVQFLPTLVTFITGTLIPGIVKQLVGIVTGIVDIVAKELPLLVQALADILPQIVSAIVGMLPSIWQASFQLFNSLVDALLKVVPILLDAILGMIPPLMETVLKMLPDLIKTAIELWSGMITAVLKMLPKLIDTLLNEVLPKLLDTVLGMLPSLIDSAVNLFLGIVTALADATPVIIDSLMAVLPKLVDTLVKMIPKLVDASVTVFLALVEGLARALPSIISALVASVPKMISALMGVMPQLVEAGFQLVMGLAKGIMDNAPAIMARIATSLGNLLINGVKSVLGIKSPSRVFMELGGFVTQGFVNGIDEGKSALVSSIAEMKSILTDPFNDIGTELQLGLSATASATMTSAGEQVVRVLDGASGTSANTAMALSAANGSGNTVNYYAAPNQSIDSQEALSIAMRRAKLLAGW